MRAIVPLRATRSAFLWRGKWGREQGRGCRDVTFFAEKAGRLGARLEERSYVHFTNAAFGYRRIAEFALVFWQTYSRIEAKILRDIILQFSLSSRSS